MQRFATVFLIVASCNPPCEVRLGDSIQRLPGATTSMPDWPVDDDFVAVAGDPSSDSCCMACAAGHADCTTCGIDCAAFAASGVTFFNLPLEQHEPACSNEAAGCGVFVENDKVIAVLGHCGND